MLSVIKALRRSEDIYSRNPLPRLLRIMDRDMTSNDMFLRPGTSVGLNSGDRQNSGAKGGEREMCEWGPGKDERDGGTVEQ